MRYQSFKKKLRELISENLLDSELTTQNDLISKLDLSNPNLENEVDKIWNFLDLEMRSKGEDMSDLEIPNKKKLESLVNYLSKNGKNPNLWNKRNLVCKSWK